MPRKPALEFSRWTSLCRSPNASNSCRSSNGWTQSMRHATTAQRERSTSWGAPAPHRDDGPARMEIDRRVFELYDEYCHGRIDRREFLARAGALTVAGVSALAMAQALLPRYARSEEHTSELQSQFHLVCRLLLEKKKKKTDYASSNRKLY